MTKLYLAGGMTGLPDSNYPAFNAEAARLRALGYHVENPAEVHLPAGLPWLTYMRATLPMLLSCDGVAHLPGWKHSKGAKIEVNLANDLGMFTLRSCDIQFPDAKSSQPNFLATDWAAA